MALEFSVWPDGAVETLQAMADALSSVSGQLGDIESEQLQQLAQRIVLRGFPDAEVAACVRQVLDDMHQLRGEVLGGDASRFDVADAPLVEDGEGPAAQPERIDVVTAALDGPRYSATVVMPSLGESVTDGTVMRWLKNEGDPVEADEPLLEVSTDKVDTEIPSPVSGILIKILVAEEAVVDVGDELARVLEPRAANSALPPQDGSAHQLPQPRLAPEGSVMLSMPSLGDVTEGTVIRWLKNEGDPVEADEPLLEVSTDKVDFEIPSPASGILIKIVILEDDVVDVGGELAWIHPDRRAAYAAPHDAHDAPQAYVTPLVRRLAQENDIDLATISGTGVGGRITRADVMARVSQRADGK